MHKGQLVRPGDLLFRYMDDQAIRELRSRQSGVVMGQKPPQTTFSAYEPTIFLIPEGQEDHMREMIS